MQCPVYSNDGVERAQAVLDDATFRTGIPGSLRTAAWATLHSAAEDDAARQAALDHLFHTGWPAVYVLYRVGNQVPTDQARDLTLSLFLFLASQGRPPDDAKGVRYRSFLKAAATNFWLDHRRRRGSEGRAFRPSWVAEVDDRLPEVERDLEDEDDPIPEEVFEGRFARSVLSNAMGAFEVDCRATGTERWAEMIRLRFFERPPLGLDPLGARLDLRMDLLTRELYKAKQAFRRHLIGAIKETLPLDQLDDPPSVEQEVEALVEALGTDRSWLSAPRPPE